MSLDNVSLPNRRDVLLGGSLGTVLAGAGVAGTARPWLKRAFHMYAGPNGQSVIRQIAVPPPQSSQSQWLLRRPAERVTVGSMEPNHMMDFHVANQPNILIPLFGSLVVKLKDNSKWVFRHGDLLFAEDCTGGGHQSGAGPDGCFSVSIQVPKTGHCLDPEASPDDVITGGGRPPF